MIKEQPAASLACIVRTTVAETPVLDVHTHIYEARFGPLLLWGIDELLTYHYLVAEFFRANPMDYGRFWAMPKRGQADLIWKHLFIERSPLSEACRGVITCLTALGLDPSERNLGRYRGFFAEMTPETYVDRVFQKANVRQAVMTNDPFDDAERTVWERGGDRDPRFRAALRIDRLILDWGYACSRLREWGYEVETGLGTVTLREIRRFLDDWIKRLDPAYLAASLPASFRYPEESSCGEIIERCLIPAARERGIPIALMMGVKRMVNPELRLAGDSVGRADIVAVENLCSRHPENRFLVTMLSRENQHELCVTARKFPNLMVFGCWWFLNNPSIMEEMTRERIELLGLSVIPQHSDARVLDQLLYKWEHSRMVIAGVLAEKYADLARAGWRVDAEEIRRDVALLFDTGFARFVAR